jgi:phenylalanyl-tRNA synthetase beta chain
MKISYKAIQELLPQAPEVNKAASILTSTGLEVEHVEVFESVKGGLKGVVTGVVIEKWKHPNAYKLNITKVDTGQTTPLQIVCGAPNVAAGQKVLVALPDATIYPVGKPEGLTIKKTVIRGETSEGMICAEDELGIGNSHDGILVLPDEVPVGIPAAEYFNVLGDHVIEIGLTPNRTDAISHYGVARDLAAAMTVSGEYQMGIRPSLSATCNPPLGSPHIQVKVSDYSLCPRYTGLSMRNIKISESPEWLKYRLMAIGVRPINIVVDIANWVMHETGQPLHIFDATKLQGNLEVRCSKEGESLLTLDDLDRKLHMEDLLICNKNEPLCIAGVFGGKESGVTENTTEIFIESAIFNAVSVRKTAKRHNLHTDASFRFERGVDPEMVLYALNRCATLLNELASAEYYGGVVDIYPKPFVPVELKFKLSWLCSFTGLQVDINTVTRVLQSLDFEVSENNEEFDVKVPLYRTDVQLKQDVAEEFLRIYGYNSVPMPGRISFSMINSGENRYEKLTDSIFGYLTACGFSQAMNNSLTQRENSFLKTSKNDAETEVTLLNPLSRELEVMRTGMLAGLIENVVYNLNRRRDEIRLFELGNTYSMRDGDFHESEILALVMAGSGSVESWRNSSRKADIFDITGVVEGVFKKAGLPFELKPGKSEILDAYYEVFMGGKLLASAGSVKQGVLKKFDTGEPVFYAEIYWQNFIEVQMDWASGLKYESLNKFPFVRRDLSLLVPKNVRYSNIRDIVNEFAAEMLKNCNLFDIWEGKNLPDGFYSCAISMILQSNERTLTDAEVDKVMSGIINALNERLNATLRK